MNIVLVCTGNFQEYILTNIQQLLRLGHKNIFVLTDESFFNNFIQFGDSIRLIDVTTLTDTYKYFSNTKMDKTFRGGFWTYASLRFFYIYEFMREYNVSDVIHLENDVLVYYNCDELIDKFDKNFTYIPFDTFKRTIPSIVYIPTSDVFKKILDLYDYGRNDMDNFSIIQKKSGLIKNLPIFPYENIALEEVAFVSQNYNNFKYVFDAAAIGQYLGGVDPRNIAGNTTGFINETCVIKYNNYKFEWITINGIKKPFIEINGEQIPIFNLHIHCKNLSKFI